MSTYEISQSSLLSLKAEVLRKKEELSKAKLVNKVKFENIKRRSSLLKKKIIQEDNKNDNELPPECENLLTKSRTMLETKAKLYDKLSKEAYTSHDDSEDNKRYLVQFEKKACDTKYSDKITHQENRIDSDDDNDSLSEMANNSEDEWVEYVDCLGRTRTCMRKDLLHLKQDDEKLKREVNVERIQNDIEGNCSNGKICDESQVLDKPDEGSELSADMRKEFLRQQWEKQEDVLRHKNDVHYQDILFDEARVHGVSYYGFSKDEEERFKQQEALQKLRAETKEEQRKTKELKIQRDKQLALRLKAARNRRRARMGLPPEEDEPETDTTVDQPVLQEDVEKQKDKQEVEREEARKKHVRPWDVGKEGVKEFYEYTQEEWVAKKRSERPTEFAPPSSYRTEFRSVKSHTNEFSEAEDKSLRFTTKQHKLGKISTRSINPYRNCEEYIQPAHIEPTLIVNECSTVEENNILEKNTDAPEEDVCTRGQGVEVAPPPTFDYYGSNESKRKRMVTSNISLEESIHAGLQFLRKEFEKKEKSTKHPDEMFLM